MENKEYQEMVDATKRLVQLIEEENRKKIEQQENSLHRRNAATIFYCCTFICFYTLTSNPMLSALLGISVVVVYIAERK